MSPWRRPNPPPSVAHSPETSPVGGGDGDGDGDSEGTGRGANTAARDNKHNLAQREQYYATIRKAPTRDQQPDRVPGRRTGRRFNLVHFSYVLLP